MTLHPWPDEELEDTIKSSSAHVRFFLRELLDRGPAAIADLKSRPVAAAQLQRLSSSRGRESLVEAIEQDRKKVYSVVQRYRGVLAPLVSTAEKPPPPDPRKPKALQRKRPPSLQPNALPSQGPGPSSSPAHVQQRVSRPRVTLPESLPLEFAQKLAEFLNQNRNGQKYRIVLDTTGAHLEVAR